MATAVGGVPELVLHEETGLLVSPNNPGDLAEAILHLLEHPDQARRYGAAGRLRVEQSFSLNRMIAETEDAYASLLSRDAC